MLIKQVFNPFLPLNTYIADGEPHVFGDRIYLFGSHDEEDGDTFCSKHYVFYSAPIDDLADWSTKGISYEAKQDPLCDDERSYLYAPDVVQGNDGRFYLYYCLAGKQGKGGYAGPISVAVCDIPDGKYQYLGFVRNPDGTPFLRYVPFDPAIINDDGVIRLYYGTQFPFENYKNFITRKIFDKVESRIFDKSMEELRLESGGVMGPVTVTLADDMLTVNSEPSRLMPARTKGTQWEKHPFYEASSIRKIGDMYYFIYSSWHNHELCYATSLYPDHNFTFRGTIISNGDIGFKGRRAKDRLNATGTNHGSIECINGQWYVFYHRLTHASDYSRQACAEPITIKPDGSIDQVEMSSCGLNCGPLEARGIYPAVICCNLTNGRMPHIRNRKLKRAIPCISSGNGQQFITNISNETLIGYKYFRFVGETALRVKYRGGCGRLLVMASACNPLTHIDLPMSENWINSTVVTFNINGIHPLYFQFKGKNKIDILNFEFISEGI